MKHVDNHILFLIARNIVAGMQNGTIGTNIVPSTLETSTVLALYVFAR